MRLLILILLFVAACSAPPKPPSRTSSPPPSKQTWRAVAAQADGTRVQGGRMHRIKWGETGIAIARAYGVSWSRIAAANRLEREAILRVGQTLFIPIPPATAQSARAAPPSRTTASGARASRPATPSRPMTPEERAAAFEIDIDDLITGSSIAGETPRPRAASARPAASPAPGRTAASGVPALSWPIDGRVILSHFGAKPGGRFNDGINIKALPGQAVRAAADGEVIYVGDAIAGFGLMMLVRHPGGTVTAYGHLEAALNARGDTVKRNQPIARAGSSGSAREAQLLFQVRQGRKALDPLPLLAG